MKKKRIMIQVTEEEHEMLKETAVSMRSSVSSAIMSLVIAQIEYRNRDWSSKPRGGNKLGRTDLDYSNSQE